jgi:uncharacterized protein (TIGR02271 family)
MMPHQDKQPTSERTIPIREEELKPRTQREEAGRVEIGKEVVSERKEVDVPLRHEEVEVEYRPVDRRPSDRPVGEGESAEIPVHKEQISGVDKQTVTTGEIRAHKRERGTTEHVSDTVRREEPRIEPSGKVRAGRRTPKDAGPD